MRIALKYVLVFLFAAVVAVGGYRLVTGRNPSFALGAMLTALVFAAIVAADVMFGW
jgi:hypothetical protein